MRIIKKYPNRRLYDTEKSGYITLADMLVLVRKGEEFKVVDTETGEDLTRSVLVQIIIDQENGDSPIFTTDMLTKFIRLYDDAAQNLFGEFLEKNMQLFSEQQKRFAEGMISPLPKIMQDVAERNLAMWTDMQKSFLDLATSGIRTGAAAPKDDDEEASKKKKRK